jgi:hypothetical protein
MNILKATLLRHGWSHLCDLAELWLWRRLICRVQTCVCISDLISNRLLEIRDASSRVRTLYNHPAPHDHLPVRGLPELIEDAVDGHICRSKICEALMATFGYSDAIPNTGKAQGEAALASPKRLGITWDQFLNKWCDVYGLDPAVAVPRNHISEEC